MANKACFAIFHDIIKGSLSIFMPGFFVKVKWFVFLRFIAHWRLIIKIIEFNLITWVCLIKNIIDFYDRSIIVSLRFFPFCPSLVFYASPSSLSLSRFPWFFGSSLDHPQNHRFLLNPRPVWIYLIRAIIHFFSTI